MSKIMRVDDKFVISLNRMADKLERELGFRPSSIQLTKDMAIKLEEVNIKHVKRKPKKNETLITFTI